MKLQNTTVTEHNARKERDSEIITVVLQKMQVFWDVTWRRLVNSCRRFGGRWHLHIKSQAIQEESAVDQVTLILGRK